VTTPEVSAILVNYNAGRELGLALQSIADELAGQRWEAVVVDNASSDSSGSGVAGFAPQARLVRNEQNVGFARGVNQGLAATSGPLVLIMNPDCRLVAGAFATLRRELEQSILRNRRTADSGPRRLPAGYRARRPRHVHRIVRSNDAAAPGAAGSCRVET